MTGKSPRPFEASLQRAAIASPGGFLRVSASDFGDFVPTDRDSSTEVLQTVVTRARPLGRPALRFRLSGSCAKPLPVNTATTRAFVALCPAQHPASWLHRFLEQPLPDALIASSAVGVGQNRCFLRATKLACKGAGQDRRWPAKGRRLDQKQGQAVQHRRSSGLRKEINVRKLAVFVSVLVFLSFAEVASAQSCTPPPVCQVGPCASRNILVDSDLNQGCPNWAFSGAVARQFGGYYWAEFTGYGLLTQTTRAEFGASYDLTYYVQFENTQPTHWQQLNVYIYDVTTGQQLHVDQLTGFAGNFPWQRRDIRLGSHPEWAGHDLQVKIEGFAYYGAVFKVTSIYLWENYF